MNGVYWWTGFILVWVVTLAVVAYLLLLAWFNLAIPLIIWVVKRTYWGGGWFTWAFNRRMEAKVLKRYLDILDECGTETFIFRVSFIKFPGMKEPWRTYWLQFVYDIWVRNRGGKYGDWSAVYQALAQTEQKLKK